VGVKGLTLTGDDVCPFVADVDRNLIYLHCLFCCAVQAELSRRREQEMMKLKKDLETIISEREMTETALRKRHQDAINELSQQLETSNRIRTKYVPYIPYHTPPSLIQAYSTYAVIAVQV